MPPLDLTTLLGGAAPATPDASLPNGGAAAVPGGGSPDTSPLGTVLARLTTAPRRGIMAGMRGPVADAPSRGGALARGVMQGLDASAAQAEKDRQAQRLQELFLYNQRKDERDFNYKKESDAANRAETKRWHDLYKSPRSAADDPLGTEKKRMDLFTKDPLYQRQKADDEAMGSRKLSPPARAELDAQVEARRKQIWSIGGQGGASSPPDDEPDAPDAPDEPDAAPEAAAPVPTPTPRPSAAAQPAPTPRPAAAAVTGGPPPGMPRRIRNPSTGEVRVWDPSASDYVPEGPPAASSAGPALPYGD